MIRRRRWLPWILALVTASFLLPASPADAATAGVLDGRDDYVLWSGSFADAAAVGNPVAGPGCAGTSSCDAFELTVDLPASVWARPGGVQVAVDWFPHEEQDLDLFVYDESGALVGRSDSFPSTGESVRIDRAANGLYTVVVVPKLVDGEVSYKALAEVEYAPASSPARLLLPNLVALPPRNLYTRTGAYYVDPGESVGINGCYPEEIAEQGAQRCLRFDQIVANTGEGPFELRYRMEGVATEQDLVQRIYHSNGSVLDRQADTYEFHAVHAHFHYKNFGQSHLYRAKADGSKGARVRSGKKNGFCMIDVENRRFGAGRKGEAPRTYYFPRCNAPTERDETGTYMTNGISAGWADVYNWFLADQMIEISGIEPGRYVLETVADPVNTVRESRENDQRASALIELAADGTASIVG